MYSPDSIHIENFMSIKQASYDFKKGECVLIYGNNMDDEGADSNGSGKTAFINAVKIALLDTTIDKDLEKEDYISDWSEESLLVFCLTDDVTKHKLKIERTLRRSESSEVKIQEGDIQDKQITSGREANKKILELLGISGEDVLNYFIIGQNNDHKFFEATDDSKKKIISRFTNSNLVDKAIKQVEVDIKETEEQRGTISDEISNLNGQLTVFTEQLEYESEGREEENKEKIDSISEEIEDINNQILSKNERLKSVKKKLNGITSELSSYKDVPLDYSSDKEEKEAFELEQDNFNKSLRGFKKRLNELTIIMEGKIACPKCKHEWIPSSPTENLKSVSKNIGICKASIEQNVELLKQIDEHIDKLDTDINDKKAISESLEEMSLSCKKYQRELDSLKNEIELKTTRIGNLKKMLVDFSKFSMDEKRVKQLNKEINRVIKEIELKQEKLSSVESRLGDLMFWKINFGNKGFKTYLVNQVLESLEGYINYHLNEFNTNLQVKINGFKRLKSGEIRENIDILVSRDGEIWKKYKRCSGGQRQRINACGILTIQTLINMTTKGKGLDLLLLDEFFEGLDSKGQRSVLEILNKSSITTMVVSHNNNDINYPNTLWFNYKDRVTTIQNEQRHASQDTRKSRPSKRLN